MNTDDARALLGELLRGIAPEVDLAGADPQAPLQDLFDLDSMDFLNLVTALHERTGISVPERDYPRLATIEGFATYVSATAST